MHLLKSLISVIFFITACSSTPKQTAEIATETQPAKSSTDTNQAAASVPTESTDKSAPLIKEKSGEVEHQGNQVQIELKDKNGKVVQSGHDSQAPSQPHSDHHRKIGSVSADQSLGWLKNGNIRFIKHNLRNDGQKKSDIIRLSSGQSPHAIVLSCSDSRVPPEVVFDQKLGEIFVVRTAGEALDSSAIASIEYAVSHLGSNLILVMGHTQCGAVKAALSTLNGADAGSPWLNKLVADIHPRLKDFKDQKNSENFVSEGWANTKGVANDLIQRSAIVQQALESGELKIMSSLYHLESGKVEFE